VSKRASSKELKNYNGLRFRVQKTLFLNPHRGKKNQIAAIRNPCIKTYQVGACVNHAKKAVFRPFLSTPHTKNQLFWTPYARPRKANPDEKGRRHQRDIYGRRTQREEVHPVKKRAEKPRGRQNQFKIKATKESTGG